MLKSILLTSLRNLTRNRSFSLINLVGLAVSMSLSLLIIVMVRQQYTYDTFHHDVDQVYRINTKAIRKSGDTEPYATSPIAIGTVLENGYSFIDKVVRFSRQLGGDVEYEKNVVPYEGMFVDPSFFEVFNFPLEKGNAAEALSDPNGIIVSHDAVVKIFGNIDPLGKVVTLRGFGEFIVTGVVAPPTGNTHIDFEILASTAILPLLEKEGMITQQTANWNDYYSGYTYIKTKPGTDPLLVNSTLQKIADEQYANLSLETRDKAYEFYLQPLAKITPGPIISNQMGKGMPQLLLIFLGILAGLVMVMACFNYTNLMIAKSLTRAKEIGIRKINGGSKLQVFFQFVGESIIFALIALVFSYVLMMWMKPSVMQLHIADEFALNLAEDGIVYLFFFGYAVLIGTLAGLLPAGYLSSFQPLRVLKGAVKGQAKLTFRRSLIVAQFTFSVIFVITVIVINQQVKHVLNADYGFNQEYLLNVRLQGNDYQNFDNEVSALAGVERVGGVSHSLGTWSDGSGDYKRLPEDESFVMRDFYVNADYVENIGLEFVAGGNFNEGTEGVKRHIILNENSLVSFGFEDARNAIGQRIITNDTLELLVVGIVKDFHYRPLNYQIGPIGLRYNPDKITIASVSYTGDEETVAAAISGIWSKTDDIHPIEMKSMAAEIDNAYTESGFTDVLSIIGYIALIAVSLACLGMLGMAMYTTQTRIKEIGLRKALGASVPSVVLLLSRSFLILIGIGILIGAPISYFLGDLFISNYAYRITITPLMMLSGVALLILLGVATITSQTIAAARRNPVKSLRYE